jgi:NADPH-dependent curcumin reductase CurA
MQQSITKKVTDLTAAVKEASPEGVDVFFDNTASQTP